MALEPGTRFGPYEIVGEIGAGGMGVVYRATDTKLKRDVAVKVLPESLAADEERLTRFQREAELLASLNHPNIAQIYGLEESEGTTALIMELVDGPTLEDRIQRGALPKDEALNIAMQIAEALEGAHGQGIVHRDLKPANIKLRDDGVVKVLDFGIAKALEPDVLTSEPQSPMLTTPATQVGVILGTAAYMSPEQARGKQVDQRADIWAFGCVLYEMLTGQPIFAGEDVSITLARVLERETDLSALPSATEGPVKQTIQLCLEKDVRHRIADIRDVRLALEGVFEAESDGDPVVGGTALPVWRRALPSTAAAVAAALVATLAVWFSMRPESQPVNRFGLTIPEEQAIRTQGRPMLAVSPDGRQFVYNTQDGLYLRSMNELEARPIQGSDSQVTSPVFSPNNQAVAYWDSESRRLKRISVNGGAPTLVADVGSNPAGISWAVDDTILYGQPDGIYRVAATGGTPELIISPEGDRDLFGPRLLLDEDHVLFTANASGAWDTSQIIVQSLSTGERQVVLDRGGDARYLPSGHLVYMFEESLFAVPFDLPDLSVSGGAVSVVQGLMRAGGTGAAQADVSSDGTLVYMTGDLITQRTLAWVDRDGREEPIPVEAGGYLYVRLSPDEQRFVLDDRNTDADIWVWDFVSETRTRLTTETGGIFPIWSYDGRAIAYNPGILGEMHWMLANNTGSPQRLPTGLASLVNPEFFSPSGDELVFTATARGETGADIGMIQVEGDAEPVWLLEGLHNERNAELSPDGRWLAYRSDESGRNEVIVRPFPNVDDNRWQVSNAGGYKPLWSRDGREIFYLEPGSPDRLMSVSIEVSGTALVIGERTPVLDWPYLGALDGNGRTYDVSSDGQRFLAIKQGGGSTRGIVVVQNWFEELRRLAPPSE